MAKNSTRKQCDLTSGVGERIREIRLSLGETMGEFGARFNTSKGTVNNWEKGRNLPNKKSLRKLSYLGGVSVPYLLGHETSVDSLIEKVKELKEYRCLKVGSDIYISEQDVIELLMSYNGQEKDDV